MEEKQNPDCFLAPRKIIIKVIGVKRQFWEWQDLMGGWLTLGKQVSAIIYLADGKPPEIARLTPTLSLATDYNSRYPNICRIYVNDDCGSYCCKTVIFNASVNLNESCTTAKNCYFPPISHRAQAHFSFQNPYCLVILCYRNIWKRKIFI